MSKFISIISRSLFVAATMFLYVSCSQDIEDIDTATGNLRLSIGQVSLDVETRATPSAIGKPLAEKFDLSIRRTGTTIVAYEGAFKESVDVSPGTYDIIATCGKDVRIGRDTPFYKGTAQVTVEKDKSSSATIPCRVANALVSVRFGRTDDEKERFDHHYADYGVLVKNGSESMSIGVDDAATSIYFPAGSSPVLTFYGTLRNAGNREVSFDLTSENFPAVFGEAEHAIVTLYLPDPETASVVDIATVDVETVTLDETIPLSWLPIPSVTPAHNYDKNGCLQGTDITFGNSYPGMQWKAEVTDAQGTLYRTVEGSGELVSSYIANADGWKYVPAGEYTATFYLLLDDKTSKTGTRTFTVGNPDLKVTASAYTSYTLYQNGDVQGANGCDPYTVYSPKVSINVHSSLCQDSRYAFSLNTALDGNAISATNSVSSAEGMEYSFANQQNVMPSLGGSSLSASLTFDKTTANASATVYVTGLPAEFAPPTQEHWTGNGTVTWEGGEVRLGRNTVSQPQYINTDRFAVPAGVKIRAPYHVLLHGATTATTLTLSFGSYEYFKEKSSSGFLNNRDHDFEDVAVFTTTEGVTQSRANNSYGSGQTCSYIYYLNYYYAE